jgi:hypothetical protein
LSVLSRNYKVKADAKVILRSKISKEMFPARLWVMKSTIRGKFCSIFWENTVKLHTQRRIVIGADLMRGPISVILHFYVF